MTSAYVHGYDPRENRRLQDQASTLLELWHSDTTYPGEQRVGGGVRCRRANSHLGNQ
jgi:hypothetical protein